MPDVISGVIFALLTIARLLFRDGKGTKKSRTSKEIREKVTQNSKNRRYLALFYAEKQISE